MDSQSTDDQNPLLLGGGSSPIIIITADFLDTAAPTSYTSKTKNFNPKWGSPSNGCDSRQATRRGGLRVGELPQPHAFIKFKRYSRTDLLNCSRACCPRLPRGLTRGLSPALLPPLPPTGFYPLPLCVMTDNIPPPLCHDTRANECDA